MRITLGKTLIALAGLTLVGSLSYITRVGASEARTDPAGHVAPFQKAAAVPPGQTARLAAYHQGEGDGEDGDDGNLKATLSPEQAAEAAKAAQPGAVTKVELENENGKAVYGVHITANAGKKYDVKVDGDTGKVIKIEADDESDGDGETDDD